MLTQMQLFARNYTLRECVEYALENNSSIKTANLDNAVAQGKIDEQIGTALPQVTISGGIEDAVQKIHSTTNNSYTISGTTSLQQKIYDPAFFTGVKLAKISKTQSELKLEKTTEQIAYSVCCQYYQTLVIQKQYHVLSRIATDAKATLDATILNYEHGSGKKIDIDKMRVTCNNDLSRLRQTNLNYEQSINKLKYQIGLPVDSTLVPADTLFTGSLNLEVDSVSGNCVENSIDYKILKTTESLQNTTKDIYAASYLPSLSLSAKYMYISTPDRLTLSDSWNQSGSVGINLTIPIFDGLQKRAKISQVSNEIAKVKESLVAEEQSIKVTISNYKKQYEIAASNLENEKANLTLSEAVYQNTLISFQQGAESSLELLQAESSMQEAQNNYFSTLLSLYFAYLDLAQSSGKLMDFVASLK
jgi:outer membrane protein TolC